MNICIFSHGYFSKLRGGTESVTLILAKEFVNAGHKVYLISTGDSIEDDKIEDVKFETFGCGSAIASSSMATELIKGKSIKDAMALTNKAVAEALDGLPPEKLHCSVLAEEAIKSAIADYMRSQGKDPGTLGLCDGDCANCCSHNK